MPRSIALREHLLNPSKTCTRLVTRFKNLEFLEMKSDRIEMTYNWLLINALAMTGKAWKTLLKMAKNHGFELKGHCSTN
jgi:hypothetical protein